MTVGQRIKYYRQLNRLSQDELAKKIGTDARTISNYETEKYKPSADTIVLLSTAFNISTDELLVGSPYDKVKRLLEEKEWVEVLWTIASLPREDMKIIKNLLNHLSLKNKSSKQLVGK